ncbi:MAG: aminotransferase class IV [Bacteroidales bacterium]|nr:aminotransferase class IV [Bacteroidales bacterium]
MYRLIESIKLKNRQLQNIEWHNRRFNEARAQLFGRNDYVDLQQLIVVPESLQDNIYKCRVLYNMEIESVEFQLYIPKRVKRLQLVEDNKIDYKYKYENRQEINHLLAKKGQADDILIVKNGCITDTSYSNIVFFDGKHWVTPDTFLLNGTKRQLLLSEYQIDMAHITPSDLKRYTLAKPINSMLDFDETPAIQIQFLT